MLLYVHEMKLVITWKELSGNFLTVHTCQEKLARLNGQ